VLWPAGAAPQYCGQTRAVRRRCNPAAHTPPIAATAAIMQRFLLSRPVFDVLPARPASLCFPGFRAALSCDKRLQRIRSCSSIQEPGIPIPSPRTSYAEPAREFSRALFVPLRKLTGRSIARLAMVWRACGSSIAKGRNSKACVAVMMASSNERLPSCHCDADRFSKYHEAL
jgi:hypothetical protein